MANTLTDPRYLEFASTYDFDRYGSIATTFTKARQGTVDKYLRQTLEENEGAKNEGVRLALYFERKAPRYRNRHRYSCQSGNGSGCPGRRLDCPRQRRRWISTARLR